MTRVKTIGMMGKLARMVGSLFGRSEWKPGPKQYMKIDTSKPKRYRAPKWKPKPVHIRFFQPIPMAHRHAYARRAAGMGSGTRQQAIDSATHISVMADREPTARNRRRNSRRRLLLRKAVA